MTRKQQFWPAVVQVLRCAGMMSLLLVPLLLLPPAAAQDVRGLEVCTSETRLDRRTGCLQANVEFLQQALTRLARDTQDKISAANRDLAAARAEIAALKAAIAKLNSELAQMKQKTEPGAAK